MHKQIAYLLLAIVLGLLGMGMVMLLSTSARYASSGEEAMYGSLMKQLMWLGIGGVLCVILSRTDYHTLVRFAPWVLGLSLVSLVLVLIPGVGRSVNGSMRWIQFGGFTAQPSEFAKLALVLFIAFWMTKYQRQAGTFIKGFLIPAAVLGVMALLTLKQPDLGVTALLGVLFFVMMFCAGTRKRYILPIPPLGFAGILALAFSMPERMGRLVAFMDPYKHRNDEAYQVFQALIALGSGGMEGLGLGNSRQKHYYLPESDTDFIFPILGEELGLWVALAVVAAFLILCLTAGWITLHSPDPTGVLVGVGLTTMICVQAMINLMVVTSMMPTKGMPLPFISYGGSNLMLCLAAIGILFNLARQGVELTEQHQGVGLPLRVSPRM